MIELQNSISLEKHEQYIGKILRVLVTDETGEADYPLSGRTNGNRLVKMRGGAVPGQFADARITGCNTWSLAGEVL